jgi:hypothetical protein
VQVAGGRAVFDSASSGLLPGDRVVTSQLSNPRDGMAIVEAADSRSEPAVMAEALDGNDAT